MATLFANGTAVGGINFVTVNNVPCEVVGELHIQGRILHREDAKGMDGVHGFTETVDVPLIKGRLRVLNGGTVDGTNDPAQMQMATSISVVVETNAGYSVSGNNGWAHEVGEVDLAEGVFDAEWHFPGPFTRASIGAFNFTA